MNQPVQDCIGDRRISDMIMPVLNGELTGNQRGAGSMSLFDDLKQIPTFGIRQRGQSQVIEDQKMGFGESFHQGLVAAIGSGQADLVEELRGSEVEGMKPFPAGLLGKGTGKACVIIEALYYTGQGRSCRLPLDPR